MGRPPLKFKMLNIRFPPELVARIDALIGTHKRPEFIRKAVAEKLDRDAGQKR